VTYHSPSLDRLVKGDAEVVVKEGKLDRKVLHQNHITQKDLLEELRLNGKVGHVQDVETATMERSGEISIVPKEKSS
jgi:uncharacterized membrane protein YcaP (DUF421 family)